MRTRLVVPSLAALHSSTKGADWTSQPMKAASHRSGSRNSNDGKSLLTMAPSSSCGTRPMAPLRASILDRINWLARTTRRTETTSPPRTIPRLTKPLPHSLIVTSWYSAAGSSTAASSERRSNSPRATLGQAFIRRPPRRPAPRSHPAGASPRPHGCASRRSGPSDRRAPGPPGVAGS